MSKKNHKTKLKNIYLEPKDKKRLNELKEKYHLSYSTIINILAEILWMMPKINEKKTEHIYGCKGLRTAIKPRNDGMPQQHYDNVAKIWLRDELKKYIDDAKLLEKVRNMIYAEFQNTYDERWNGNTLSRFIPKFIKQNKDYVKKILETEDGHN